MREKSPERETPLLQDAFGQQERSVTDGATRTVRSETATLGTPRKVTAGSARGWGPNAYQASDVKRADGCIAGAGWPSENK